MSSFKNNVNITASSASNNFKIMLRTNGEDVNISLNFRKDTEILCGFPILIEL